MDSYLLKAVVSFCSRCQPFRCSSHVPFSAPAGQVTQQNKWHALSGDTCFFSYILFGCCNLFSRLCLRVLFFSHPLSFHLRLPPLFVFMDKCPFFQTSVRHPQDRCFVKCQQQVYKLNPWCFTLVKPNPQPGSAAVGSVTAMSPLSKKMCACFAPFCCEPLHLS